MKKFWDGSGWVKKIISMFGAGTCILGFITWIFNWGWGIDHMAHASTDGRIADQQYNEQKFQNEDDKIKALKDTQDKTYSMVWQLYQWELERHKD